MVGELKNYIANMNTTGNISLNITKATAFLKNQKRSLEANLVLDASREYTALLAEIRSVDAEISAPVLNELAAYQRTRSQVKGIIENTQAEREALAEKVKKSRQVLADGQFTDRSLVAACEEKARSLYDSFCTAERECKKRSRELWRERGYSWQSAAPLWPDIWELQTLSVPAVCHCRGRRGHNGPGPGDCADGPGKAF